MLRSTPILAENDADPGRAHRHHHLLTPAGLVMLAGPTQPSRWSHGHTRVITAQGQCATGGRFLLGVQAG